MQNVYTGLGKSLKYIFFLQTTENNVKKHCKITISIVEDV